MFEIVDVMSGKTLNEAEQLLVDSINSIKYVTGQTFNFAKEQIPDVIQQLLVWNMTRSALLCLLTLVLAWAVYKDIKDWRTEVIAILGGCFLSVSLCFSVFFLIDSLKIWIAPKVWILEYAANLIK
jgi:hypothetical protein